MCEVDSDAHCVWIMQKRTIKIVKLSLMFILLWSDLLSWSAMQLCLCSREWSIVCTWEYMSSKLWMRWFTFNGITFLATKKACSHFKDNVSFAMQCMLMQFQTTLSFTIASNGLCLLNKSIRVSISLQSCICCSHKNT